MDAGWTRLPGDGWLKEMGQEVQIVAEAKPGGFEPQCWVRDKQVFAGPLVADSAYAAGMARGWLMAMTEEKAEPEKKEGGAE